VRSPALKLALKPETCGVEPAAVQLKLVPVTPDCSGIEVEVAEQIAELLIELVRAGFGLTVSTTKLVGPAGQPKAVGVTV